MEIFAREKEKKELERIFYSKQSEFVAVYGRRRVGKTYLVRHTFKPKECIYFELVGQKQENGDTAPVDHQLANCHYAFEKAFGVSVEKPDSWDTAFRMLKKKVDTYINSGKTIVIFIDELPWLCTPNSQFYENLDQAWNACFEPAGNIKVIVCGSASTWMLKRIIYAKAGLSRRVTLKLHLRPFTLRETQAFLQWKNCHYSPDTVAEAFMVFGGIPYYLNFLMHNKSLYQNIEEQCFSRDGHLANEYDIIFDSLFKNSSAYKRVMEVLSQSRKGKTHNELHTAAKVSTGRLHTILHNLYECDFIDKRVIVHNRQRGTLYFLHDEFTLFYVKWIQSASTSLGIRESFIQSISRKQAYKVWLGFSFEMMCMKHHEQIKHALGLAKIAASPGIFYAYDDVSKKRTTQIDLLFDRADKTITICEIKYQDSPYELQKKDFDSMKRKKQALENYLRSKRLPQKSIVFAWITPMGLKKNAYYYEMYPEEVVLSDLFV